MNKTAEIKYAKAFAEVFYILSTLTDELRKMIPNDFINLVKDNMDKEFVVDKSLIEQRGISVEAQAIMALIYIDFLCDDETRDEYLKIDKKARKYEESKYQDALTNNKNVQKLEEKQDFASSIKKEELIVYKKENFFERAINILKRFFKKKKTRK